MRTPGVIWAHQLADKRNPWPQSGLPDGRWVLSRPEPFYSIWQRWRATWLVFTGRADALLWTDQ
jgi:hypothetical protein